MRITGISHLIGFLLCCCTVANAQNDMQGVCLTGPPNPINDQVMLDIKAIGAEWVCLMPYAYGPDTDGSLKREIGEWQWWGERKDGTRAMIRMAHDMGLKVMVKPHLWLRHGFFTGSYHAQSEAEWLKFEEDYHQYILDFAVLCEEEGVELLCIGTELELFVTARTIFWNKMIDDITNAYSGDLTYAANWDEVHRFPLWCRLSFVGIDGYFPLTSEGKTSKKDMLNSWKEVMVELDQLCDSVNRTMVFCEIGYRSCSNCAEKPWEHDDHATVDEQCQIDAYECFFKAVEDSEHYGGSFLWKWYATERSVVRQKTGYTPQGKPALSLIKRAFQG